jgi:prepilin peptidase CpaA
MNTVPHVLIVVSLLALLAAAACCDVKRFRIPNLITAPGVLLGLALNALLPDALGLTSALYGLALGLLGLLPLYLLRIWGAGDVKLVAMVGAFLGPTATITTVLFSFVAGGVIAVLVTWQGRKGKLLLDNLRFMIYSVVLNARLRTAPVIEPPAESAGKLAYAVPILAGTVAYIAYQALQ